jgi:hypothetical protein
MSEIILHNPERESHMLSVEEHIECCANIARSLWLLLTYCELDLSDSRNIGALSELANMTADHASAARCRLSKIDQPAYSSE